ncbi:hypothetical protein RhiLY_13051 [Ceratobasidium sp. AG-Ba]|nr:hypothetical protein RhiLY_13051 [Ceratobasidium sp. AG-Ba]
MAVQPLARGLVYLSISPYFERQDNAEEEDWYENHLHLLFQYTTQLKRLEHDAAYDELGLQLIHGSISQNLMQHTSGLKLEILSLSGLHFTSAETLESVPSTWPMLTSLCINHTTIRPHELQYFARLPNLVSLALIIPFCDGFSWPVFNGTKTGAALQFLTNTGEANDVRMDIDEFAFTVAQPSYFALASNRVAPPACGVQIVPGID